MIDILFLPLSFMSGLMFALVVNVGKLGKTLEEIRDILKRTEE